MQKQQGRESEIFNDPGGGHLKTPAIHYRWLAQSECREWVSLRDGKMLENPAARGQMPPDIVVSYDSERAQRPECRKGVQKLRVTACQACVDRPSGLTWADIAAVARSKVLASAAARKR